MTVRFRKRKISDEPYEACSVFDVNQDGRLDIVSGAYWYEGPDFNVRHKIADIASYAHYRDDFSDYPMDVDGDGRMDLITGSWWSESLRWRRNPGDSGKAWDTFEIMPSANIETIRFFDIDGCGVPEIFPNTPGAPQAFYKLIRDERGKGTGQFGKTVIGERDSGHGLGFADITGNGRTDIVLADGWLEQPDDPFSGPWTFHPEFSLGSASVPILGHDVNGDGLCDLIVGQAHDYGLHWYEQVREADGSRSWIRREIDASVSQYHDLALADLDGDGELELVAGKRYLAHDFDPGADDPLGLYYFKIGGGRFEKHVIDYGPPGEASGNGIFMWIQDITGNGYPDIVAPGTEGLYLFENLGSEEEDACAN
ncbi:FG-GAP repeat domain-containing protein [Cohnella nanjingensis]|uniref:VCBS repeat-containing protein n=1 Tax=Cohnella nanjingensis TaxID=1387779 RepID=A0A7X0VIN1_9BACL|nr:VCBS repeat-containing protein [Cohnella nanjingensis]MBB6674723.1 VCBS repeat-containing protein [Cohnella nanjingensis]